MRVEIPGWLLVAMVLPLHAAEPATPEPEAPFLGGFIRESRIVYPLQVGGWKAVGEKVYDQQEYGVSVRYVQEGHDGWVDLFYYPAGVLSAERFGEVAALERENLRRARVQAGHPEPEMGPLRTFPVSLSTGPDAEKLEGYSTGLEYRDGEARSSAMALVLDRMYFIKLRYTTTAGRMSPRDARKAAEGLMREIVPELTIVSTGECWQPLPIERLTGAAPEPQTVLMSIDKGTTPTGFLLADRVVSRDPDAASAKVAMMMGMAKLNRLVPGCHGSEPVNPDVPEGMREIRLEYRKPSTEPGPPAMAPLRGRTRGAG